MEGDHLDPESMNLDCPLHTNSSSNRQSLMELTSTLSCHGKSQTIVIAGENSTVKSIDDYNDDDGNSKPTRSTRVAAETTS